ncbi:hypothetical protein AC1031_019277 [Aphanomyces cochlioides]|nr:hypothetical protein AC1031_019277 [Aphanomyces cochlioides]
MEDEKLDRHALVWAQMARTTAIVSFAKAMVESYQRWIYHTVAFVPCAYVYRITWDNRPTDEKASFAAFSTGILLLFVIILRWWSIIKGNMGSCVVIALHLCSSFWPSLTHYLGDPRTKHYTHAASVLYTCLALVDLIESLMKDYFAATVVGVALLNHSLDLWLILHWVIKRLPRRQSLFGRVAVACFHCLFIVCSFALTCYDNIVKRLEAVVGPLVKRFSKTK